MPSMSRHPIVSAILEGELIYAAQYLREKHDQIIAGDLAEALHACATYNSYWMERRLRPKSKKVDPTFELVSALLEMGAKNFVAEFIVTACGVFCPESIELLIAAGHSVNVSTSIGITPLMSGCDNRRVTSLLIKNGCDPSAIDRNGLNALHYIGYKYAGPSAIASIVRAGVGIDSRDNRKMTPLMYAARTNRPDTLIAFLKRGADIAARDQEGSTAWDHALQAGYILPQVELQAWRYLSGPDANVEHRDEQGRTPLMHTPLRAMTVRELLERGGDPNARDMNEMTPLMYQSSHRLADPDALSCLVHSGASTEAVDREGRSAILHAARCQNVKNFFTLIRLGCAINVRDAHGKTAYDYAVEGKNKDLDFRIKALLDEL